MWVECVDSWVLDLVSDHIAMHSGLGSRRSGHEVGGGLQRPAPSSELTALLDEALAPFAVECRTVFGGPAYFIRGVMIGLVYGEGIYLRIAPTVERSGVEDAFIPLEPVPGLTMREFRLVPSFVCRDGRELSEWVANAVDAAAALPPREETVTRSTRRPGASRAPAIAAR